MGCEFCNEHNNNLKTAKAKMLIDRPNGNQYIEKINAYINKTEKGDTKLVLSGFVGFEKSEDIIDTVTLHIKFCPFCGKKIGA